MKYILFFILMFSLNTLHAMRYPKLTAEEVQTIGDDRQLLLRLAREGQRVRAFLEPEDFQQLENVWTTHDVLHVQAMLQSNTLSSNRSVYHNGQHSELLALVSSKEIKTIFSDKQISLDILEFCGFAVLIGFRQTEHDMIVPDLEESQNQESSEDNSNRSYSLFDVEHDM